MRNTWNLSCLSHDHFRFDTDCPFMMFCLTVSVLCVWWLWNWENMKPSLKGKHETQKWPVEWKTRIFHLPYLVLTDALNGKTWNLLETGKHETHHGENMKPACDRKTWNPKRHGLLVSGHTWFYIMRGMWNLLNVKLGKHETFYERKTWNPKWPMGKHETCLRQENMKPIMGKTWNLLVTGKHETPKDMVYWFLVTHDFILCVACEIF